MSLLIYTFHVTNRIKYVFDHIFKNGWGIDYSLIDDIEKFKVRDASCKLIYDKNSFESFPFFYASGLLHEQEIKSFEITTGNYDDCQVLFIHNNKQSLLSFDVLAAIFYLLSRYEEYVAIKKDMYGNFDVLQSILHKLNILHIPVVEQWLGILKQLLQKNFPQLEFKEEKFSYAFSFDVDVAFAYKHKGFFRTASSLLKNIFTGNFTMLNQQLQTLFTGKHDVYDTCDYIAKLLPGEKAYFFLNMGSYGKYDKNPSVKNTGFRRLIKKLGENFIVGLHPSYRSNYDKRLLQKEKSSLEEILEQKIEISRQHYLKLSLPATYQNIMQQDIAQDFTMGYYFDYGFRAGTCKPFLFYDLEKEQSTNLTLYPFAYMDGTLNNVLQLSIAEAKTTITDLIKVVKKYNGFFIPLWHNSTLSETNDWQGWREVFEHTIKELQQAAE